MCVQFKMPPIGGARKIGPTDTHVKKGKIGHLGVGEILLVLQLGLGVGCITRRRRWRDKVTG